MTAAVGNDFSTDASAGRDWDMTVCDLAIFMCVFRAPRPPRLDDICSVIGGWFECSMDASAAAASLARMLANQWVAEEGGCFRATDEGRRAARRLMNGVIRLLDQGTRLIDVALMMTVLRLTKGELDDDVRTL